MKEKLFIYAIASIVGLLYFPILYCYLFSDRRGLIDSDVERRKAHQPQIYKGIDSSIVSFLITICLRPEFRKQCIWRLGGVKTLFLTRYMAIAAPFIWKDLLV